MTSNFEPAYNLVDDSFYLFKLETDHVHQNYVNWLNTTDINRYLESRFEHQTLNSIVKYVQQISKLKNEYFFGIYSKILSEHVGNVRIHSISNEHSRGEIGILIGEKKIWGQGLATKVLVLINQFCKHDLKLRMLTAGCYHSNIGSQKAFVKAGYKIDGIRKNYFSIQNGFEDLVLMSKIL